MSKNMFPKPDDENNPLFNGIIPIGSLIDRGAVVIDDGNAIIAVHGSPAFVSYMLEKYFLKEGE